MISRGNWRRPPPGPPEINRDLARGITEAHIIGSVPYNALTGVRDDIWDSTNAVSNGGVGRRTTTANTAVKLLSPNNTAAGDFTVIWYGKPEAFGSGYTALWDKGNGGTRENTLFFDTSNAISYVGVGGTHGGWAPGVSVSLNRQNVVILRRSGSTVSACINGKLGSTTFSSSGTSTSSDGFFWMGQNISGGGSSSGAIHNYLLVFNRCITDAEAEQASTDAWFYFRKSPRNLIFIPSAGGGGATLTADSGTYTLTGTAVTLKADRKLAAGSGSYAVTGTDAALKVGRKLSADSGTYSVTGTAVNFLRGYALAAESGSYSVSGTDAALRVGRLLSAASGSYVLSGSAAALQYQPAGSYSLTAESGAYTLTGTAATLKASRKLTADSGTYALTGTDVTLTRGFKITADSGTYTLTGSNVAFARTYRLPADSGSYALSGSPVSLSWSGEVVPVAPTHGGPSIYGKAVFREAEFKREYEREVSRIENERIRAIQMREDEELVIIMAALAA